MSGLPLAKWFNIRGLALAAALCAASSSHAAPERAVGTKAQTGVASWHAPTGSGCRTASRRRWVNTEMIAAHRTLPLGTKVRVVNLSNGHEVTVQITDRGPYYRGRIIDVSRVAAQQLGLMRPGTARVRLETLPLVEPQASRPVVLAFRSGPLLD